MKRFGHHHGHARRRIVNYLYCLVFLLCCYIFSFGRSNFDMDAHLYDVRSPRTKVTRVIDVGGQIIPNSLFQNFFHFISFLKFSRSRKINIKNEEYKRISINRIP